MDSIQLWRWNLPDLKGRIKPSTWRMTEADAQARCPGCKRVTGSLELRQSVNNNPAHSFHSGLVRRDDGTMLPPSVE